MRPTERKEIAVLPKNITYSLYVISVTPGTKSKNLVLLYLFHGKSMMLRDEFLLCKFSKLNSYSVLVNYKYYFS